MVIDRKHRGKVRDASVFDQLSALAVENQPAPVQTCGEYGMVLPNGAVAGQGVSWMFHSNRRLP